jgi:hypothetical protein
MPERRAAREVMAELVAKLSRKLEARPPQPGGEKHAQHSYEPNRDRLTVGVDLGDKWSNYCVLGLDGETLTEGELPTAQQEFGEFFKALAPTQ